MKNDVIGYCETRLLCFNFIFTSIVNELTCQDSAAVQTMRVDCPSTSPFQGPQSSLVCVLSVSHTPLPPCPCSRLWTFPFTGE